VNKRNKRHEATGYLLNGAKASKKSHPWHVALVDVSKIYEGYFCAGTIVSPTAVVTGIEVVDPGNEF
jgi:secreted trypsin-like serine protease